MRTQRGAGHRLTTNHQMGAGILKSNSSKLTEKFGVSTTMMSIHFHQSHTHTVLAGEENIEEQSSIWERVNCSNKQTLWTSTCRQKP
jgi:hypothetical protein